MIKRPLILIFDAMSQVFRAYYAVRNLSTSRGVPTNATYGFLLMLNRVLEKFPPEYIAMVWDSSEPTPRHVRYPEYKATRERMPQDLVEQVADIKRLCQAMRIPSVEVSGQEADDVIATIARRAKDEGIHPVIVTLDKDMMQLVDEDTRVLQTSRDDRIVDAEGVREQYGVTPERIPDLLGLWGDSSDNIPGAPGIGEKGARALIERFGSLEDVLEHAGDVSAKRQRESLLSHRDQILLSKELVTIDRDVEMELDWNSCVFTEPDRPELISLLRELEFTSQLKELLEEEPSGQAVEVIEADETPDLDGPFAFALSGKSVSLWTGEGPIVAAPVESAAALLSDPERLKIVHDLKSAILELRGSGIELSPPYDDSMLMAYLLAPNRGKYELEGLVGEYFGQSGEDNRAAWTHRLHQELRPRIQKDLEDVYTRIELPLASILAEMERQGVLLDVEVLQSMSVDIERELEDLTARIYELAGTEFNINSPKQLGEVMFEKLNLPRSRKLRKSGQYSTSVEVLEELAVSYELPRLVLDFRQRAKFKSTYIDVLPTLVDSETGRLHTSFNQVGAATGRLSSSEPNLQNIPIRTELGRTIRRAFVAPEGTTMLAADYSQVELRILAHLSGDARLTQAFIENADIHRTTAAEVLGIPVEDVDAEQRSRAKAVNFGIVYGQTPFGLARQLGISRQDAEDFIDRYFERYPGVRDYIENSLAEARDRGFTRTIFGRIRPIPEINSRNGMRRSMAERMAINAPIQGTAADIIKLAMIRISTEIRRRKLSTRMLLQVHDELIFEVPDGELEIAGQVCEWMSGVADLSVPLVVDSKTGPNWRDLRKT